MSEPINIAVNQQHGSINVYNNLGCRCDPCKAAWRAYQLPQIARRKAQGLEPDDPRHGTYSGYSNWGCRRPCCVEANRLYSLGHAVRYGKMTEKRAKELGWNG